MTTEEIKTYVAQLMNEERKNYSNLINNMITCIGSGDDLDRIQDLAQRLLAAKLGVLDKVYNAIG